MSLIVVDELSDRFLRFVYVRLKEGCFEHPHVVSLRQSKEGIARMEEVGRLRRHVWYPRLSRGWLVGRSLDCLGKTRRFNVLWNEISRVEILSSSVRRTFLLTPI